jgi:monothiol glutaredoxin
MDITQQIKALLEQHPVVLFMKGTPQFPQCGFSMRTVQALQACGAKFHHVDVLAQPEIRKHLPQFSQWPTFPQVFINGELVGGCDIVLDLYQRGELKKALEAATVPAH